MKLYSTMMSCGILTLVLSACAGNSTVPTTQTQPQTQTTNQQSPVKASGVWIDVRTPEEFQAGHLDGAINIINDDLAQRIANIEPNKNAPINLYCRSGRRAEVGRKILMDMGYTNVTNHGSYEDLVKKGIK